VKLGNPSRKNKAETIIIDDFDVWNLDHTLALIIVPALKVLKKKKQGAPFVKNEDVPKHLRAADEEMKINDAGGGDTDKHYFDRWDWVIDEMIWAFQQKLEDWEESYCSGETDVNWIKIKEKDDKGEDMYEMVNGPNHTFDVDMEGTKKHQTRIDNGIMLFAKYYEGLWD
tara:strand:- start:383 stop:892 length:510 start_codon:yes stop_codon:yes gene_type:complete